jgi:hypothetical protein
VNIFSQKKDIKFLNENPINILITPINDLRAYFTTSEAKKSSAYLDICEIIANI